MAWFPRINWKVISTTKSGKKILKEFQADWKSVTGYKLNRKIAQMQIFHQLFINNGLKKKLQAAKSSFAKTSVVCAIAY
jgi:hypothetical protein